MPAVGRRAGAAGPGNGTRRIRFSVETFFGADELKSALGVEGAVPRLPAEMLRRVGLVISFRRSAGWKQGKVGCHVTPRPPGMIS